MVSTLSGNPSLVALDFENPKPNPISMLQEWLSEAESLGIHEPRSLILSTVNQRHHPTSRVVFLRSCDETGVIFATSQTSRKGKDMQENPYVAGTLWWRESLQQINFQGHVTRLVEEHSDAIFHARTREAQSIAVVSKQSAQLTNPKNCFKILKLRYTNKVKLTALLTGMPIIFLLKL
jgi:pyridoxamine 5'-phosphate oxidase